MANIKVNTRFGELNIDPSQVIVFPRGIPGFEKNTKWKLLHELDEQGNWGNGAVVHLQSVDDGEVSLPLTNPALFGFSYDLVLSDSEVAELKLEDPGDVLVLTTLSVRNAPTDRSSRPAVADMYANISAPILINTRSRIGMQKTLAGRGSTVGFQPVAAA